MSDYTLLQSVFGGIYASDLGKSELEAEVMFRDALKNEEYRKNIEQVVQEAFSNPDFSWVEAFDEYEVYPADDEEDAKSYAKKILWDIVFPGKECPVPTVPTKNR